MRPRSTCRTHCSRKCTCMQMIEAVRQLPACQIQPLGMPTTLAAQQISMERRRTIVTHELFTLILVLIAFGELVLKLPDLGAH